MPMLDMPLAQLKEYQGINPRPIDFDAFWDEGLAEMKAVDPQVEMVEAEFQAPGVVCQHLYFTGVGNVRIHANFVRPENADRKCPAILSFHGYTSAGAGFLSLLPYAYAGFYCFSLDVRGQGGLSQDASSEYGPTVYGHIVNGLHDPDPRKLFFRNVFLDTAQLAGIAMAMEQVDENRVAAMGGSQGGALTLACASLEPRVAFAAPQYPWLCDYKRVWEMDQACNAYQGLKDYFRHFDPRHEKENEIFEKLGYIDVQFLTPRIKGKVFMSTGLMDNICPPSTQFAAFNKITSPKEVEIYPDFGHEWFPGLDEHVYQRLLKML